MMSREPSQWRLTQSAPTHVGPQFRLHLVSSQRTHTLVLAGELDLLSARHLRDAVAHLPMDRTTTLVLDLHDVTFIDCSGIRTILAIQSLCAEQRCGFSLLPGPAQVQRMFELCNVTDQLAFLDQTRLSG
jgi:anti-anti-sigma factor